MKKAKQLALVVFGMLVIWNCGHAQDGVSRRNSIQIGYLRSMYVPVGYGTIGYEYLAKKRISLSLTAGVNPIRSKHDSQLYARFHLYALAEGRYYFGLWRKYPMSGFYVGLGVSRENLRYYFRGTNAPRLKSFWDSVGFTIGYQHAFGDLFRLSLLLMPEYTKQETSTFLDRQGNITYRGVLPVGFIYTFSLRFGITL